MKLVRNLKYEIKNLEFMLNKKITKVKLSTDKYIFQLQDDLTSNLPLISLLDNTVFPRLHYRVHDMLGVKYDEKTNLVYDYYLDNFVIGKIVDSQFKILDEEIKNECKNYGFSYIDDIKEKEIETIKKMINNFFILQYLNFFGINDYGELYHRPTGFIIESGINTSKDGYRTIIGRRNKYDALIPFSVHDIVIYDTWRVENMPSLVIDHYKNPINHSKYRQYLENKMSI